MSEQDEVAERRRSIVIMEGCDTCRPEAPQLINASRALRLAVMCPECANKLRAWILERGI